MRKLLLVLVFVLGAAGVAGGRALSLKVVDVGGSEGRDGSLGNPLFPSDIVGITVVLQYLTFDDYPHNSGWWVDGLDLSLDVMSGPGSLDMFFSGVQSYPEVGRRGAGDHYFVTAEPCTPQHIAIDGYAGFNGWTAYEDEVEDDIDFLTGFLFHCDGRGPVEVALNLDGPVVNPSVTYPGTGGVNIIAEHSNAWKYPGYLYAPYWRDLAEADLGSIVLNQVPEPITIGLLGLGGLAWQRRRRRTK